jgi:hypothetical protein
MKCGGIILLGYSSNSKNVFTLQRQFFRIMAGAKPEINVLACSRDYRFYLFHGKTFVLMNFVVNIQENCQINSAIKPAVFMLEVLGSSTKFR